MNDRRIAELGQKLNTQEARAEFIREAESGLYGGKTDEGLEAQVYLDKGVGMRIFFEQKEQSRWWIVGDYDSDGCLESMTFERRR